MIYLGPASKDEDTSVAVFSLKLNAPSTAWGSMIVTKIMDEKISFLILLSLGCPQPLWQISTSQTAKAMRTQICPKPPGGWPYG